MAVNPKKILTSPDGQMLVNGHHDGRKRFARQLWKVIQPHFRQISWDLFKACQDTDIIVTSQLAIPVAYGIAEKLRLPLVRAFTVPLTNSRSYPALPVLSAISLGERFNLLTHALSRQLYWLMIRSDGSSRVWWRLSITVARAQPGWACAPAFPTLSFPTCPTSALGGQRVHDLGAGPRPFAPSELTLDELAAAIDMAVTHSEMRRRAVNLGGLLRAEQGAECTLQAVDEVRNAL